MRNPSSGIHCFQQHLPEFQYAPAPCMEPASHIRGYFTDTVQQLEGYKQHQPPNQQCTLSLQSYLPLPSGVFAGDSQGMYSTALITMY